MLTTKNVYVLSVKKKTSEPLRGLSLVAEHKLSEVGLYEV